MSRQLVPYTENFQPVMDSMTNQGLLLGSYDADGRANIMAIGWGAVGSIWSMPVWTVLVRPSRYTHECIEHSGGFTVNVLPAKYKAECLLCGSKSGRDTDKFAATHLTAEPAGTVSAPVVAECPIVYECKVVHCNDLRPDAIAEDIPAGLYTDGDYHRVYWGKIMATLAEPDAAALLRA